MGRVTLLHLTPGIVSTSSGALLCASWNALILLYAMSKASLLSALSSGSSSSCGCTERLFSMEQMLMFDHDHDVRTKMKIGCQEHPLCKYAAS